MPNTKAITSAASNILLIGDSGTHKTWFAGTCPKPYVFDFDGGVSILRGKDIEYDVFRDKPKSVVGALQPPTPTETRAGFFPFAGAWPAFIRKLNDIGTLIDKGTCPYQTLYLDSLTFLSEIAMNHVVSQQKEPVIHIGSYGAQQQYIKSVLGQLTAWPIRVVCTAHIQRDTNDITKTTEKLPLLTGKLAGFISAFFDEVYFCEPASGPGKFVVKSSSTKEMRQAKSRWGVPDDTELDFAKLLPFYSKVA